MKVSELPGDKKREWDAFMKSYHEGKLSHHTRKFLWECAKARLGLTFTYDRFARYLQSPQ